MVLLIINMMKEEAIKKLRSMGVKVTPQRLAIIDFLEKNKIHPSAEMIFKDVIKNFPTISFATVYNTLEKLEEAKFIQKLKIADENKVNYEYNMAPHDHFFCRKCKKIYDVNINKPSTGMIEIEGHKIEEIYTYIKGICKNCG